MVMDGVKKVSVTDVICASKGCSRDSACTMYTRLLSTGAIAAIARTKCPGKNGRGGAYMPIPFASAEEVVNLLHARRPEHERGDVSWARAMERMVRFLFSGSQRQWGASGA